VGEIGGAVDIRISEERKRVLQALAEAGEAMSSTELARAADLRYRNAADLLLSKMVRDSQLVRAGRGKYDLPDRARTDRTESASGPITH
jgi:hypothetical protein